MATITEEERATLDGFPLYRITIDRYERMIEAGVFEKNEPVFLWRGQLVKKMTKGWPHSNAMTELIAILVRMVPLGWHVRPEQPVLLSDESMPEPDLTIIRGATRDYHGRRPTPRDVSLVVEVSDSSLSSDSGPVWATYAREGIPIYWIVNLPHRRIEIYTEPTGPSASPGYQTRRDYGPEDEVPVVLDGVEVGWIAVGLILPATAD